MQRCIVLVVAPAALFTASSLAAQPRPRNVEKRITDANSRPTTEDDTSWSVRSFSAGEGRQLQRWTAGLDARLGPLRRAPPIDGRNDRDRGEAGR